MTKNGVEANLARSPYKATVYYGKRVITYYFSTNQQREKFFDGFEENRTFIKESLENRFKIKCYIADDFCDLNLYRKLERRGFYIEIDGRPIQWAGNLVYNGEKLEEAKEKELPY